ncbi:Regulator of rDNA transcription protein 5 [Meyerozyma sp. JA9]|nr:Regulator of rDNA transcription protein 5 [Meyerozyma sp. JA9]
MSVIEDRIYIGNVDYNATEEELREFFANTGVTSVEIPSKTLIRGKKEITRRLGFAFVSFESKEAADKAVEEFNDKQFKSRKIFVKKAVPPPTEEEKLKKSEEYKAKKAARQKEKAAKQAAAVANGDSSVETTAAAGETADLAVNGDQGAHDDKPSDAAATGKPSAPKKKKTRKPKKKVVAESDAASEPNSSDSAAATTPETAATTPGSAPKAPEGTPSPDTVFITNLHYQVRQRALISHFKELKPKWVHVPLRRVPYRNRKEGNKAPIYNKGIAFIKFPNHEVQQEAISKFNGHEIEGRAIVVEVAIDTKEKSEGANGTTEEESEVKGTENNAAASEVPASA